MNSLSAEVSLQANVAFEVKSISKHFTGMKRPAVDSVSMRLKEGEIVALLGSNGVGKTTLNNVISGFIKPTAGSIHFKGQSLLGMKPLD
ncbi:MAG: ATP-binding cassette domain-containing protein, partial [Betaproteobacteria bacterium]|nr:ATP-binding cassette domain-containing protein [Betaproteobacteria bacterium]